MNKQSIHGENGDDRFIIMKLYEFIHMKLVFVHKISNLFIQFCESFKHIRL